MCFRKTNNVIGQAKICMNMSTPRPILDTIGVSKMKFVTDPHPNEQNLPANQKELISPMMRYVSNKSSNMLYSYFVISIFS
jgi:hypothetical protein